MTVGTGMAHAELSFSKCNSLGLMLLSSGTTMNSASGPSVLVLDTNLTAGSYSYDVSGGRCSFTLTITSAIP